MSLPKVLNYGSNKPMSANAKASINRYRSDNSSYTQGDTVRIEVPTNRNGQSLFPHDSFLEGKIKINGSASAAGASTIALDQSIYSIFSRLRVIHGSTVLEDTLNANKVWTTLLDIQLNASERCGNSINLLVNDASTSIGTVYNGGMSGQRFLTFSAITGATDSNLFDFCLNIPSALVGSLSQKALPIGEMGASSLYIELELAPASVAFCSTVATTTINSYTVQDIYYNAKIATLPSDVQNALNSLGKIELPAFSYKCEVKALPSGISSFNDKIAFNYSSIKTFMFFLQNQATANGAIVSRSVSSRTKGNINEYYLSINGESYPTQPISNISRMYCELQRSFDALTDTNFGGILSLKNYNVNDVSATTDAFVIDDSTTNEKRFVASVDLEKFNHSSEVLMSGTSTIGQSLNLIVNFSSALGSACNLYAVALYDVIYVLENGQLTPKW